MMRFSKWAFYWMLALISVVFAESFSGSTPIIMANPVTLLFYGLHYFLIVDFLVRHNAITLATLAVAGLVIGFTTESILTKIIWNPPYNEGEETFRILGLGLFEVGFTVTVWHVWMSTALPIALCLKVFGLVDLFTAQQLRRLLLWLPVSVWLIASFAIIDPFTWLLVVLTNGLAILFAIFLYRLLPPIPSIQALILNRFECWLVIGLLGILYVVGWFEFRPEAMPEPTPFAIGMFLVFSSIVLLYIVRHRYRDQMPLSTPVSFTYGHWLKYMVYFTGTSFIVASIAFFTAPVSSILTLLGISLLSLRSNWHIFRLALRRNPRISPQTASPALMMPRPSLEV